MDNVQSAFLSTDALIKQYIEENNKFLPRFVALSNDINNFISASGVKGKAEVNAMALGYLLIDYFEDIKRLKDFHIVEHINSIKIVSYMSYWLLRRKPIQISACEQELIYINERFVLAYILDFLSTDNKKHILVRENIGLNSFSETLFYFLKYRVTDATSIEMFIFSFFAGQIYQEDSEDISHILSKKYQ